VHKKRKKITDQIARFEFLHALFFACWHSIGYAAIYRAAKNTPTQSMTKYGKYQRPDRLNEVDAFLRHLKSCLVDKTCPVYESVYELFD
jgi:hypothetical protein